jgi:hypothetical protein
VGYRSFFISWSASSNFDGAKRTSRIIALGTLIGRPFDFDTLAVRVHNLASDERLAEASTAALLIVLVGLLPVVALVRAMREGS